MVVALGSMVIKGVFKAGSLLSGLGKTSGKLKEVKQRGKSTTTEMKRMTGQTHLLSKAMAAIGVAGFSALLMTTPQLAGSLAKIKHEMTMLAWSIGKHLKPALDAVATILRGIRTGDWATVKQGIEELTESVVNLIAKAGTYVLEIVFGKETVADAKADLERWWNKVKKAFYDGDLGTLLITLTIEPIKWVLDKVQVYMESLAEDIKTSSGRKKVLDSLTFKASVVFPSIGALKASFDIWSGLSRAWGKNKANYGGGATGGEGFGGGYQTGGMIPKTGMYRLHAGETVTMQGSSPGANEGPTEINIDFSGANINLASGIELDQFADAISNRIAERQHSLTY